MDLRSTFQIDRVEQLPSPLEEAAGPDFNMIALYLDHLLTLTDQGWWAEWGGCMWAEEILRNFGPLVAGAARRAEAGEEWTAGSQAVLGYAQDYLSWERLCASGDDPVAVELAETAQRALEALRSHLAEAS